MNKFDQLLSEINNNMANPANNQNNTPTSTATTPTKPSPTPVPNNNTNNNTPDIKTLSQTLAKNTNPQEIEKILTPLLQKK